jgi:hypothetical protein
MFDQEKKRNRKKEKSTEKTGPEASTQVCPDEQVSTKDSQPSRATSDG